LLREEIRFEHQLIANRLSALLTAQSFLLTTFAVATRREAPPYPEFVWFWYGIIPAVGLIMALLVLRAVAAGEHRLEDLRNFLYGDGSSLAEFAQKVCPALGPGTQRKSLLYAKALPVVFAAVWSCAAVAGIWWWARGRF
jgi:hypothetical protein